MSGESVKGERHSTTAGHDRDEGRGEYRKIIGATTGDEDEFEDEGRCDGVDGGHGGGCDCGPAPIEFLASPDRSTVEHCKKYS